MLIEALTYRQKGHSRSDPAKYRPEDELERWLERDPIVLHERALLAAGRSPDELAGIRERAEEAVRQALETALSWDDPSPDSRLEDVFA